MSKILRAGVAVALIAAAGSVTACASGVGSGTYGRSEVGSISRVEPGVVVASRQVLIEGTKSGIGTASGAIAGGAIGSTIGGGTEERIVGGVVGAVLGGVAGSAIEEGTTRQTGMEYTIRLDRTGETVLVTQGADVVFPPGSAINVVYGDRVRITPRY